MCLICFWKKLDMVGTLDARGLLARQRWGASERVVFVGDSPSRLRRSILSLPTRKNTSGTQGTWWAYHHVKIYSNNALSLTTWLEILNGDCIRSNRVDHLIEVKFAVIGGLLFGNLISVHLTEGDLLIAGRLIEVWLYNAIKKVFFLICIDSYVNFQLMQWKWNK